jgi:Flp pilus assembly protein TadB
VHHRLFITGLGLLLLFLTLVAMAFTFRYEVNTYYTNKHDTEVLKKTLQQEVRLLKQPQAKPNRPSTKQKINKKEAELKALEKQGILSHLPEWPLLILGALSVIATRVINYFVDAIYAHILK